MCLWVLDWTGTGGALSPRLKPPQKNKQTGAFNNKQSIGGTDAAVEEARIPDDKVWWVQCESLTAAVKVRGCGVV